MVIGLVSGIFVLILVFTITNVRANRLKSMTKSERKVGRWERMENKVYIVILILYWLVFLWLFIIYFLLMVHNFSRSISFDFKLSKLIQFLWTPAEIKKALIIAGFKSIVIKKSFTDRSFSKKDLKIIFLAS